MYHDIRWTAEKIEKRLALIQPLVYRRRQPLPLFELLTLAGPEEAPPIGSDGDTYTWQTLTPDAYWTGRDTNFVLRTRFRLPDSWLIDAPTGLHLPIGEAGDFSHPEALVYIDRVPYAACDRHHQEILLAPDQINHAPHELLLHGWTGTRRNDNGRKLQMHECALVQIDQATRDLVALTRVALGVVQALTDREPARAHLLNALDETFKALDTREPFGQRFYESVPAALAVLRSGVAQAGPALDVAVTAAGHAHIDVAWLWTLAQTRRKASRTFHNVLRLMAQFPAYHFTQSQPQLYEFVRQDDPSLFDAIRERVAEGRWEPIGGMWVEADCNLSGPESLARQFLLGRTFFREQFGAGVESPVLWLPDVFGYAWNLPQLIVEAGLKYFFTIKIGWNQYNRLPYDSFWWQGLDGTRVLTHFSPTKDRDSEFASTYNADASPSQVLSTWTNFLQKDCGRPGMTPPLLMSYGFGDGGGGPTREMLENIRELADFPAMPRVRPGKVIDFFETLEKTVGDRLPTWNGELYLEYHRGTYTTQARNKHANRKSEFLLHDAEWLAAMASILAPDYTYPHEDLRRAWQIVCLNQFHDIIPGSSIGEVYRDSLRQYAAVRDLGERVRDNALTAIGEAIGGDLLIANATSFPCHDLALWPAGNLEEAPVLHRADGVAGETQPVEGGLLIDAGVLPPYSVTPLTLTQTSAFQEANARDADSLTITPTLLENTTLRVELNEAGDITRIYDKVNGREVLPRGAIANQFQIFEDRPRSPDAWDIDIYYDDRMWTAEPASSVRVVESGPLRAMLEIKRQVLNSELVQRISLTRRSPRLDFRTAVQWRERHIMLKTAFPVDVLAPAATYEIQWGNVQRPTHRNTSWDWARFETCAQKWVDLSEGNYGVSLLNDCKYGHDIRDNVIRLTLLRGPTDPDPKADLGEHHFAYSLLPHAGGWDERTIAAAYALNDPLIVAPGTRTDARPGPTPQTDHPSFVQVDRPNVAIETVKQAEDGEGIIVRLYESQRRRGPFTLEAGFPLAAAERTNLLEETINSLEVDGQHVHLAIKPYQILTLRLLPVPGQCTEVS